MTRRIRSRELRLGRSLREIVMSVLAAPLAGAVACHAAPSDLADRPGSVDATAPQVSSDAASGVEAANGDGEGEADGAGPLDAAADAELDPDACGSIGLDAGAFEGDPDGCVSYRLLPCGLPSTAHLDGCFVDLATCVGPCRSGFFLYCQLAPVSCDDAGNLRDAASVLECISCNGIAGRRPRGLSPARLTRRTPVGDYFASMAHLESASVRAFRDLARALDAFGAPAGLSLAARRSEEDERRHARATSRLARRFGGIPSRPRVRSVASPTLVELLEDDAVEGCVKETFGALLATWQSERSADPRVRRTMRRIAADETRHAALAWDILRWGTKRLPPRERLRVEGTLERALVALESGRDPAIGTVDPAICRVAGHPSRDHARGLARELARLLRAEGRPRGGCGRGGGTGRAGRNAVMRQRP